MGTENLSREEAWKKLRDLVDDIKIAMMITGFDKAPVHAVPMRTKKVDKQGNIWFLSLRNSTHDLDLIKNKSVQLLYSDPSDMEFLSVYGDAEVTSDKEIIEELYSKMTDNWFDGPDDPNITAIRVRPEEAYYWDTKMNKYVSLFKLGFGAMTGKKQDPGEKGKLNL